MYIKISRKESDEITSVIGLMATEDKRMKEKLAVAQQAACQSFCHDHEGG
jgi:hypothetical protein